MLSENLIKLYNTLNLIETKGENTKLMDEGRIEEVKLNEILPALDAISLEGK